MKYKNLVEKLFKAEDSGFMSLDELINIKRIPTISPSVNYMLQGGLVPSRFYGFSGPPSGGKSMFAVSCCAEFLKQDEDSVVIWFDAERSFTNHWLNIYLKEMGLEELKSRFLVKPVSTGGEVFDYFAEEILDVIQSGLKVATCVVDSVQSLIPPAEVMADDSEKMIMAGLARYLPQGIKRIIEPSRKNGVTWFFICQVRDNMDMFTQASQKYVIPGGNAFHHFMDAEIMFEPFNRKDMKVFSTEKGIGGKDVQIGHYVQAKMLNKCRIGVPNRVARFKFLYNAGIVDTHEEIIEIALNKDILETRGSNFYFKDQKLGVGKADLSASLRLPEKKDVLEQIWAEIVKQF